jgi:hypothetical protein
LSTSRAAAGLAEHAPGEEDPWTPDEPAFHGLGQTRVGTTRVAHGGEAALQHALENSPRLLGHQAHGLALHGGQVQRRNRRMDVRVDEARHQGAPSHVDAPRLPGSDFALLDGDDSVALDDHAPPGSDLAGLGVQDRAVVKGNLRHDANLPVLRARR